MTLIFALLTAISFIIWIAVFRKDFYSYWTVLFLAMTLFFALQIPGPFFAEKISDFSFIVTTSNTAFMLLVISLMTVIVGILITSSNISLVKHEGFGFKRVLGIPIIVLGTLSVFLVNVKVIRELLCYSQCMLISYFIVSYIAVKKKISYDKDFVIILGCLISKTGSLLPLLKSRTNKAIHFAWDQEIATGKVVKYVPSGGQGANEVISEGSAIEMYLLTHGAEDYEVFTEKKSRNTYENMKFSKAIIDERTNGDYKVAFATTNYHVFRSGILAKKVGLNAEGISSTTRWYFWPAALVREFIGFMDMHIPYNLIVIVAIALVYWMLI